MKLSHYKIGTRLFWAFGFILFLILGFGILSIIRLEHTAEKTFNLYYHPLAVSNNVRDIKANIIAIHRSMKDVALAQNEQQILENAKIVDDAEKQVYEHFEIVFERFLGDKKDVDNAFLAFKDWKLIRDEVIQLSLKGNMQAAAEITKGKGAAHVELMTQKIQIMIDFANNKADTFLENAMNGEKQYLFQSTILIILIIILGTIITIIFTRSITNPLNEIVKGLEEISTGNLTTKVFSERGDEIGVLAESYLRMQFNLKQIVDHAKIIADGNYTETITPKSDKDELSFSLNNMVNALNDLSQENYWQTWRQKGQNGLNAVMRGQLDDSTIATNIISYLAEYLDAQIGAFYIFDETSEKLKLIGRYAFTMLQSFKESFEIGEGIIGQAALEKKIISITELPEDYIKINSALGHSKPKNIVVCPIVLNDKLIAVIELGTLKEFDDHKIEFIESSIENIAININSALSRTSLNNLLQKTQEQARILQEQQIQLQNSNVELEEYTDKLLQSESQLKAQREELQTTNEELEEKTHYLTKQKEEIESQNVQLEEVKMELEQKAKELEITSKYKSEFLANMSHELRTPLNSLLVLSEDLAENRSGNFDKEQIESVEIISKSGRDLLSLINEILDLSKIEAGKMKISYDKIIINDFINRLAKDFSALVYEKQLKLITEIEDDIPDLIFSDPLRVNQIMRNLISNAIKFTEKGVITIKVHKPSEDTIFTNPELNLKNSIGFSVIDTGIGIPEEKQLIVFEAFQQIDGSTSRKYAGTGLGLSITRELVKLIGGEINLQSVIGKGSTFSIFLPIDLSGLSNKENIKKIEPEKSSAKSNSKSKTVPSIEDDRENIKKSDKVVLAIEDDLHFATVLSQYCKRRKFKFIHAGDGKTGLKFAKKYLPEAIILDIKLPDIKGWDILQKLKEDSSTRHIPVQLMTVEEENLDSFRKGAIGHLTKPISNQQMVNAFSEIKDFINRSIKNVLIIGNDKALQDSISKIVGGDDIRFSIINKGEEAKEILKKDHFDCVILDLNLPDCSGFEVLETFNSFEKIKFSPIIIYTGRQLTKEEENKLKKFNESIIVKNAKSEETLLDETALFLHRVIDKLPKSKKNIISRLYDKNSLFQNKKLMVVDDDMRNVYAISKILEGKGLEIIKAANGKAALEHLENNPDMDLVLMDIMMPVMDGYQAIKEIRKIEKFWNLPIIALTANAMKEDKTKCIDAGANDYLSKPVDVEKLLSLLRVWMYK